MLEKRKLLNIKNFFEKIVKIFIHGNVWTKMSFLFMGISNLKNKQVIKGTLFLFTQISFIFYIFNSGVKNLLNFFTLGTREEGFILDEKTGMYINQAGDDSILFLIFGVCTLLIITIFLNIYILNIKSAYKIEKLNKKNIKLPSFKEDILEFLDKKFHITLLTLPVTGVIAFTVMPLIFMILIAFTSYDSMHRRLFSWIGFENFLKMFSMGSKLGKTFGPILSWTIIWAILATVSNYILGIFLALLINKKGIKFKGVWRTIFVTTIAIPQFISLLIMRNMLHEFGPINEFLKNFNIINNFVPFLTDGNLAKVTVLIINLWVGIPYTMLITSGILLNIPQDIYESAKIDGASAFTTFRKITLPYILFITAPYLITQFIGNINNFNIIYLLTEGGPATSKFYQAGETDLLITWLYKLTVNQGDYNIASTIGICVFIISVIMSLLAYRKTSSYGKEEEFA